MHTYINTYIPTYTYIRRYVCTNVCIGLWVLIPPGAWISVCCESRGVLLSVVWLNESWIMTTLVYLLLPAPCFDHHVTPLSGAYGKYSSGRHSVLHIHSCTVGSTSDLGSYCVECCGPSTTCSRLVPRN